MPASEQAHGTTGFGEWLLTFHGKPPRKPQSPRYKPEEHIIDWHHREVFRGPAMQRRDILRSVVPQSSDAGEFVRPCSQVQPRRRPSPEGAFWESLTNGFGFVSHAINRSSGTLIRSCTCYSRSAPPEASWR